MIFKQKSTYNIYKGIIFRYQVHEPSDLDSFDNGIQLGFRPQNLGSYDPNSRPLVPGYQDNNGVLVGPGGPTGIIGRYSVCSNLSFKYFLNIFLNP